MKHLAFAAAGSLFLAVDWIDPRNSTKRGLVLQVPLASKTAEPRVALDRQSIAGLYVDPDTAGFVYSTVTWGEEALAGTTSLYQQRSESGHMIFDKPVAALLLGIAW